MILGDNFHIPHLPFCLSSWWLYQSCRFFVIFWDSLHSSIHVTRYTNQNWFGV